MVRPIVETRCDHLLVDSPRGRQDHVIRRFHDPEGDPGMGDDGPRLTRVLLEAGAGDYLEKSADAQRFLARVRAVLRRAVM